MDIPGWFGLLMAVGSFVGGVVMWYKGSVEKRYAARRDFEHLKRNYSQLSIAIEQLDQSVNDANSGVAKELNEIRGSLNEMKMLMQFLMSQQGGNSQGVPMSSGNPAFYTRRD